MDQFDAWGTRDTGLFTFAHSAKHVALYQKFGFHARFLTAIMSAPAQRAETLVGWSHYSALSDAAKDEPMTRRSLVARRSPVGRCRSPLPCRSPMGPLRKEFSA